MKPTNGSPHPSEAEPLVPAAPTSRTVAAPPSVVAELAGGCVRFVEQAVGVTLDYEPETLPLVDHWIEKSRVEVQGKPEVLAVVAHTAGAYFGEVVRRRHPSWWRTAGDDPAFWRIELEDVYLAFSPVELVRAALARGAEEEDGLDGFELLEDDRAALAERLAELPEVTEGEYYALSTRLEVIDIAVDAVRARRMGEGEPADAALGPGDYERD